jgi:hypothetical protein
LYVAQSSAVSELVLSARHSGNNRLALPHEQCAHTRCCACYRASTEAAAKAKIAAELAQVQRKIAEEAAAKKNKKKKGQKK